MAANVFFLSSSPDCLRSLNLSFKSKLLSGLRVGNEWLTRGVLFRRQRYYVLNIGEFRHHHERRRTRIWIIRPPCLSQMKVQMIQHATGGPPGAPPGGNWMKDRYCGWKSICLCCWTLGSIGCCVICCPCDERTVSSCVCTSQYRDSPDSDCVINELRS